MTLHLGKVLWTPAVRVSAHLPFHSHVASRSIVLAFKPLVKFPLGRDCTDCCCGSSGLGWILCTLLGWPITPWGIHTNALWICGSDMWLPLLFLQESPPLCGLYYNTPCRCWYLCTNSHCQFKLRTEGQPPSLFLAIGVCIRCWHI